MNNSDFTNLSQMKILQDLETAEDLPNFDDRLKETGLHPLTATGITILQLNVGRLCNQSCKHCHVNAGPRQREVMPREIFDYCLQCLDKTDIPVVDITGGAPELNPDFRWFVREVKKRNRHVIDRCNLTIALEPGQEALIDFLADHDVEIIASLPALNHEQTDAQRGKAVFDKSIEVLKRFNQAGYGVEGSPLQIHLMANPVGAFLPSSQVSQEAHWKAALKEKYDITFNNLFMITNMPIGRYLTWLKTKNLLKPYMNKLIDAYNPQAAQGVMCRYTLSVDWQGYLYDCDFNQMLNMKVNHGLPTHIRDFDPKRFRSRQIVTMLHCYGCTAGCGSSCGGATAEEENAN